MVDTDKLYYLNKVGLDELMKYIKPNLLTTAQKNYLNDKISNLTATLTVTPTMIEYGVNNSITYTVQTYSAGKAINADAIPTGYQKGSGAGVYNKTTTSSTTTLEEVKVSVTSGGVNKTFNLSKTVPAYSKILYGSSVHDNILKTQNGYKYINSSIVTLTEYSNVVNTSVNTVINIPKLNNDYYGYILIPVGIKRSSGEGTDGGITVAPGLKSTTSPTAKLPGGIAINFQGVNSTDAPEYVYYEYNSNTIKYRFIRTGKLSKSGEALQITLI